MAQYLYQNHRAHFDRVLEAMQRRVPGVSDVEARPTEDGRLVLRFRDGSFSLDALADAYENDRIREIGRKARFRNPDAVTRPTEVVSRIAPGFQKISGARLLGTRLTRNGNRSHSFRALIEGLDRIVRETSSPHPRGGKHTG